MHRRLAALESGWGLALFERTPAGHELTPHGQVLFQRAEEVDRAVLALQSELSDVDKRRVIRLTTTDDIVEFLSPKIAQFCADNREVQVRLHTAEEALNLVQREADVAIRFIRGSHQELVVKPICTMAFGLYCSAFYLENHGPLTGPADFPVHGFIVAEGALGDTPIMKWLSERVSAAQIWSVCNTVSTMTAAASGGLGVAPLPCFVGDTRPDLVRVLGPIAGTEVKPLIAYHVALRKSERVQDFVTYLKRVFAEHEDLFAGRTA